MGDLGKLALRRIHERIDALESRVNDLTRILDTLLYELEEGTHPRRAAMVARDDLECHTGELEATLAE